MRTKLIRRIIASTLGIGSILTFSAQTGVAGSGPSGPLVYGVNPYDNTSEGSDDEGLWSFEASTATPIEGQVITIVGGPRAGDTVLNAQGLTTDPTTGDVWAVLRLCDFGCRVRYLATIDLDTAEATTIGQIIDDAPGNPQPQRIASIAFDDAGVLYGVSGDGQNLGDPGCSECLYTISKTTATATKVATLGNGGGGEAIAFNPLDDRIYHFSGGEFNSLPQVFEKIDPANSFTVTPITLTGDEIDEVIGMVFEPNELGFLTLDQDRHVSRVTTNGFVTDVSSFGVGFWLRGLVIVDNSDPVAIPDEATVGFESDQVEIDVLENDLDGTTPVGSVTSVSEPSHGSASVSPGGGSVMYQPGLDYCNDGTSERDTFTYQLDTGSVALVEVLVLCPTLKSAVTLKYALRSKTFKGQVTSSESACVDQVPVTIYRRTSTGDTNVQTVNTNSSGAYSYKTKARGKYFARTGGFFVGGVGHCEVSDSPIIRVRP